MHPDRHGRAARAGADPNRRPPDGYRLRDARRFAQLVTDLLPSLPEPLRAAAVGARIMVRDVPPEASEGDEVALAEATVRDGRVEKVVVYRRPAEARAFSRFDLADLVREAMIAEIAQGLGLPPVDPGD